MSKYVNEVKCEKCGNMGMKSLGRGKFMWCGKETTLDIVKLGKRDVTLRSEEGTLITFNKKYVAIQ